MGWRENVTYLLTEKLIMAGTKVGGEFCGEKED